MSWLRGAALAVPAVLLLVATSAYAAVGDYVGRPIAEVRLQINGRDLQDPVMLNMIVTRPGAALAMIEIRESMAHLFGLGLYQDVQVDAVLAGDRVVLTYNLIPAYRVRRILFEGQTGLQESDLRRLVVERHGSSPSRARADQAVSTVQAFLRERGYAQAKVTVRVEGEDPANAAMVFVIQAGRRARIADIGLQGPLPASAAQVLGELNLRIGDEDDGVSLEQRLIRYADELRGRGYYEARLSHVARFLEDGAAVGLSVTIDPGPRVEIVFEGDPIPSADRDRLVPVAREHSVDEDILEDSKFGVERYLRDSGYCSPRVDYQRAEQGAALRITFAIVRGSQCTVEQSTLVGNTSITSAELAPLLLTRAGQAFNESTVGGDVARIQSLYRQRGFASAMVTSQVERGEARGGVVPVTVRLMIAEGVWSVVQSVAFRGNASVEPETLRKSVTTAAGQAYFDPQIAADAEAISHLYLNRGYQEVAVRPEATATADGAAVDLVFNVQEGPQILIDHVLVVGNERTSRETILREVQLKSGQPLSQQQEVETRARLAGLGLFRRVDISYLQLPGERLRRDVVITVEEAPVTTIGYGGGLEGGKRLVRSPGTADAVEDFQFAPRGFFEVTRRNLFGKDRSINMFMRVSLRPSDLSGVTVGDGQESDGGYGFNEYLARVTYGERRVFGTEADITVSGGVEQGVRSSFDFHRRGGSAIFTRRVTRTVAVSARYGLDHTELLNIKSDLASQPEIDRLFPQVRLSSVSFSLVRDTRNDSFEPSAGTLLGTDTEVAARRLGSQVGFLKTFVQAFAFRRLPGSSGTVAALGARVGLATGFPREVMVAGQPAAVVDDLPASERFYAGGDTTVRGFALDRLGPMDAAGFPTGGHGLIVLNGELRIPVRRVFTAVVFLDGGNVFDTVGQMSLTELRGSAGVGLRYRSPVGPIRLDLGVKLDRLALPTGEIERPTALHISLGEAF